MSGLYIHVPFCKKACHYCDFHFSTSQSLRGRVVAAICSELDLQKKYLNFERLETVYFGGGTPSLLSEEELAKIITSINKYYSIVESPEITLEANPDDLTEGKLDFLKQSGINRLSIGVQSFNENHLKFLNRSHSSSQAIVAIEKARSAGFDNISLDLIYAIPSDNHSIWKEDVEKILKIKPEHISAYCLTIEEKTAFGVWTKKGKMKLQDEEFAALQYEILIECLINAGYTQYEVSNFCLPGYYSKHNSNYWKQKKYLGVGPGAHSYNGINRQFNISNNAKYTKALEMKTIPCELDILTPVDRLNEFILTSLRTNWGLDLSYLKNHFGQTFSGQRDYIQELLDKDIAVIENESLVLTRKGMLFADKIASDLFFAG